MTNPLLFAGVFLRLCRYRAAAFLTFWLVVVSASVSAAESVSAPPRPSQDAQGNRLRYAATGHISNYDESKVGNTTLPDPLVRQNGQPVRDAQTWLTVRRAEILSLYETEVFGRVPATVPKVAFEVVATDPQALGGAAVRKHLVVRFGDAPNGPTVDVVLFVPAKARQPVPLLLQLLFGMPPGITPKASLASEGPKVPNEVGPISDFVARGYAYATFCYKEIEGDGPTINLRGVRKLALAPGQEKPADGEWGTIAAWGWGTSRVLDCLATDPALDAKRVGLVGHSRLGKTALWVGALDPRFAVIFASCSGEMGASLARRDFGESVDDVVENFPWWFTGHFQKYAGHWNDLPVDAHLLIALSAPRRVFVTGGTKDLWADPRGEFLAQVAAGPVYRLLGKKDLGTTVLPPLDTPLTGGDLGFHYHTGGHDTTAADWTAFLEFAERTLRPRR